MDKPELTVAELRSAVGRLLDAVEHKFGPVLSFPEDYYWNVHLGNATAIDSEPTLDLGSVADDAESVRQFLASGPDEHTSIWHESEHIGGILRSISRLDRTTI